MGLFIFRVRASRAWRICLRDTLSPIFDKTLALQILPLPASIYLSFLFGSEESIINELSLAMKATIAFVITIPIWFVFNLIRSPFCAIAEEKLEGKWFNTAFVYNEPKLLLTAHVRNTNNNVPIPFQIKDILPGGSIELRIEKDGMDPNVLAMVREPSDSYKIDWWGLTTQHNYILTWAPKRNVLNLWTYKENQNPSIIRVYLLSFNAR